MGFIHLEHNDLTAIVEAWLLGRYPITLKERDARHIVKCDLFTSEIKCYFSEEVHHAYVVYRKHKCIINTSMGQT